MWRHQKYDHANYDQFTQNFDMTYRTIQLVSVPNLKLFGPMTTTKIVQRGWKIFYYVIWENGPAAAI